MPGTNLTRQEAAERAALLSVEAYEVEVDLTSSAETFPVRVTVIFDCVQPGAGSFIDFIGDSVESVELNGTALDPATAYADGRIALPDLAAHNTLRVEATGRYMHTGEGLHRFVDPVDGEVYLYTQFETADSRRMFPVFEQPDLKAHFTFTVVAPERWRIISCQPTPEPAPLGERSVPQLGTVPVARWEFAPTPRLSSYITALIAGPYDVVTDTVRAGDRDVPLGLFCRRSLTPYLDADNVFAVTKAGFAFFQELFDLPYPFEKYDQIFTPEYNAGAMENVGAVTFNEIYVFRAKVPDAVVERRALTILHELAHMWFGNLVTMRWWDDLWLNESFAEWASMTCQAEATDWTDAWATFASVGKSWALRQDQLSSTHPIAADIRHLHDVEVNFDGITYAKGAAALKQLVAYVGREAFVAGIRTYFREFAYANTTLDDLLAHLEATSGRDLGDWSRRWLQTAGPNTLRVDYELGESEEITSATVRQEAPPEHPTLRPHRLSIGLYEPQGSALARTDRVELDVDGPAVAVPQLVGKRRPALLLVNDDDLTYAKIRLDQHSLATLLADPHSVVDPLPRALLLGATWDMTRDAEMAGRDFIHVALEALSDERDSTLLRMLLAQVTTTASLYVDRGVRSELRADISERLIALAMAAEPGSDAQLQLVGAAAAMAHTPGPLGWVRDVLSGRAVPDGLTLDTEMRWTLLTALAAGAATDAAEIAAEGQRDATSTGRERAARADASLPTPEAKARAWDRLFEDSSLSNQMVDAICQGWSNVHDPQLLAPFVEPYHRQIRSLWEQRTHAIAESIAVGAYPAVLASPELFAATEAWLAKETDAPDGARRIVAENRDAVLRAVRAQARDGA